MILKLTLEEFQTIRQALLDKLIFLESAKIESDKIENVISKLPEVYA